jgi:hypothetical protein
VFSHFRKPATNIIVLRLVANVSNHCRCEMMTITGAEFEVLGIVEIKYFPGIV